jgi:hypothetical protein
VAKFTNLIPLFFVRCEASRYFRNKKRAYLKDKISELATTVRTRTSETCVEE